MLKTLIKQPQNNTQEEIKDLGIESAYNQYILLDKENIEYTQIRHGINIKFDIYKYFQGTIKTKEKKGLIIINKKIYEEQAFMDELEARLILIKKRLIKEAQKASGITVVRGMEELLKQQGN